MASVFVLATDGGTHSADSWADMMGQLLFPISPDIAQHKLLAAKSTQLKISEALAGHTQKIMDAELGHLGTDSDSRFAADHDGHLYVEEALKAVHAVTDETQWKDHMRQVEPILRAELQRHFDTIQNVERMHHSDHNPSDAGDAYKAQYHGVGV